MINSLQATTQDTAPSLEEGVASLSTVARLDKMENSQDEITRGTGNLGSLMVGRQSRGLPEGGGKVVWEDNGPAG